MSSQIGIFLIWKCLICPEKYILDENNDSLDDEGQNVLGNCQNECINLKEKN